MLLEFELENHRAFAEARCLSLIAGKLKEPDDGRIVDIGDYGHTRALTSALVLGKNGSGKSTLVDAMRFVCSFVRSSSQDSQQGEKIKFHPNLLVDDLLDRPTRYRVAFSMHGTVYDFEFSHNATRIISESLQVANQSVRFRKMYERSWNENSERYEYSFGDALSGKRQIWAESTRENALFISTASQLNSEDIKPAFEWLTKYLRTTSVHPSGIGNPTAKMCLDDEAFSNRVVKFLQSMDINLETIEIEREEIDQKEWPTMFAPELIKAMTSHFGDQAPYSLKVFFNKKRNDGETIRFPLANESTGTQALFNLAGPLFDSLKNGYCLIIDEINTSLHPVVVSFLVDLFADASQNCKRAQLIFTSHDTSVMAQQRMRRDQVWVIENFGQSAQLIPLSDFSPRKGEALDKGYLGGRYGGIPIVTPAMMANWDV